MKDQNKERVPIELMEKLRKWATTELSEDELSVLNTVFGVYHLGTQKKSMISKEYPEYLKEIAAATDEEAIAPFITTPITPATPTTTTTTTITTIASHPWITCKKG